MTGQRPPGDGPRDGTDGTDGTDDTESRGDGEVAQLFVVPDREAHLSRRVLRQVLTGLLVFAVLTVLGAPVGLLWHLIAPRTAYVFQDHVAYFAEQVPDAPVAADGWFAVLALALGVLTGSLVQGMFWRRLLGATPGLALGALAGSIVAWKVGHWFGAAAYEQAVKAAADGTHLLAPLDLRATGVLVLWPLAASLTLFLGVLADEGQQRLALRKARRAHAAYEAEQRAALQRGDAPETWPG